MVGAAGALGIAAAAALSRATPAFAATDGDVVLGGTNVSALETSIQASTPGDTAFIGIVNIGDGIGLAGFSDSGAGVLGTSNSGDGVLGRVYEDNSAVHGKNLNTSGSALGFGILGEHGGGGVAIQGNSLSPSSSSITPTGVQGLGQRGVVGLTVPGGTGVYASAAFDGTGVALEVVGPATFTRSGIVSIAAGKKSATVTGVPVTASSLVLAMVQNNAGVSAAYAVPTVPGSSFTINLNKAVPLGKTAKVAWFVVN